jgi:hypothetical protein
MNKLELGMGIATFASIVYLTVKCESKLMKKIPKPKYIKLYKECLYGTYDLKIDLTDTELREICHCGCDCMLDCRVHTL